MPHRESFNMSRHNPFTRYQRSQRKKARMPDIEPKSVDVVTLSIHTDKPGDLRVRGLASPEPILSFLNQAAEMMRTEIAVAAVAERTSRIVAPG